jgi:hypothetical protein
VQVVAAQGETARPGMKVLTTIMPVLGYRGMGPGNRPVPSKVYFDLATWHLVNTNYAPRRMAELKLMRDFRVGSRSAGRADVSFLREIVGRCRKSLTAAMGRTRTRRIPSPIRTHSARYQFCPRRRLLVQAPNYHRLSRSRLP